MKQQLLRLGLMILLPCVMSLNASIYQTAPGVEWSLAAFSPSQNVGTSPILYLGAETVGATDGQKPFGLARATLAFDAPQTPTVKISRLAPASDVVVNGAAAAASPFYGQSITNLVLPSGKASTWPLVTINSDQNVYLITKPEDGTAVLKNDVVIKDAGANDAADVNALAASTDTIFAAVSQNGGTWVNGADRGIAVLKVASSNDKLIVYDATDFTKMGNDNKAVKLSLLATADDVTPRGPVAFYGAADVNPIVSAVLTDKVEMFHHAGLDRLYIGLENVERDDNTKPGGAMALLMGRVDDATQSLVLQPVIDGLSKGLFYGGTFQNTPHYVTGFYADGLVGTGDNALIATVEQIKQMATSTGKDYLIVNSKQSDQQGFPDNVFVVSAIPLLGKTDGNGNAIAPEKIGTISKIDPVSKIATFDSPPTTENEMIKEFDTSVRIFRQTTSNDVSNIFVQGDTVYLCKNAPADIKDKGVFASTAIFDESGAIRAWTQLKRVFGSSVQAFGGGLDTIYQSGDFYALTTETLADNTANTVRITQWGRSDKVAMDDTNTTVNNLTSVLERIFPVEQGGLIDLLSFDEKTPGFVENLFGMMVALGPDKIALIQTVRNNGGQFELITNFIDDANDPDQNVFVFDTQSSPVLADIFPLTGAEVARTTNADQGWLFVSGLNGVVVLSLANGDGWDASVGLDTLSSANAGAFPAGANWSWKSLVAQTNQDMFANVHKLVAANGRMYVETLNGIFFFDMDNAGKFDGLDTTALGDEKVNGPDEFTAALIADLVVLAPDNDPNNNRGVIATSNGVFASNLSTTPAETAFVQKIGDLALGLQLIGDAYDPIESKAPTKGNILAFATDFENNNDTIYRFDIPDAGVGVAVEDLVNVVKKPNANGLFMALNDTRQRFMSDGTFIYSTLPKNYGSKNYLVLDDMVGSADMTPNLAVDITTNRYISDVLRDGASGAIMVSGDWGVRVNQ